MAYIWIDEVNVNVEMVRLGWGRFWIKYGKGKYAEEFREAEQKAREAKRGLWGGESKMNSLIAIAPLQYVCHIR